MEPTIVFGSLPLITEGPTPKYGRKGELDTVSWKILVSSSTDESDLLSFGFARDSKIASYGHSIWVDSMDHQLESDLLTEITIAASGLIFEGERRQRVISAGQREISVGPTERVVLAWGDEKGEDPSSHTNLDKVKRRVPKLDSDGEILYKTISTPSGIQERWNIKDSVLTVRDTYFTTTRPDTTVIGTTVVPPNPPDPPEYIWADYTGPKRGNHPNGWVLDDRSIEVLHETSAESSDGLFKVTDSSSYYYTELPD